MKKQSLFSIGLLIIILIFPYHVKAKVIMTGRIYKKDSNKKELLFIQKIENTTNKNKRILKNKYTDPEGKFVAVEETVLVNGMLSKYTVHYAAGGCGCTLKREGDDVVFNFERDDKKEKGREKFSRSIVTGPTMIDFIVKNWQKIYRGESVYFLLPAMNMMRLAKFKFDLQEKSVYGGEGRAVIRLNISNIFFRFFIDPVDFVFDKKNKKIIEIHGPTLLPRKVGNKYETQTPASIYYIYHD